ncbi:MAG: hypothetical protein RMJ89_08445, partial [Flammeovirgaceae bacterium]|nr:hypothetical protein [Flammeovirgaceae bacterium]
MKAHRCLKWMTVAICLISIHAFGQKKKNSKIHQQILIEESVRNAPEEEVIIPLNGSICEEERIGS